MFTLKQLSATQSKKTSGGSGSQNENFWDKDYEPVHFFYPVLGNFTFLKYDFLDQYVLKYDVYRFLDNGTSQTFDHLCSFFGISQKNDSNKIIYYCIYGGSNQLNTIYENIDQGSLAQRFFKNDINNIYSYTFQNGNNITIVKIDGKYIINNGLKIETDRTFTTDYLANNITKTLEIDDTNFEPHSLIRLRVSSNNYIYAIRNLHLVDKATGEIIPIDVENNNNPYIEFENHIFDNDNKFYEDPITKIRTNNRGFQLNGPSIYKLKEL